MHTNPVFDAWLFIIGSTGDHQALGFFKYVFVILFLVLIAASLWIALKELARGSGTAKPSSFGDLDLPGIDRLHVVSGLSLEAAAARLRRI